MPGYCCVPHCNGRGGHTFPSKPELRELWIKAVKRKEPDWTPSKWSVVCYAHFELSDYHTTTRELDPANRRILKDGVVPHVFGRNPLVLTHEEKKECALRYQRKESWNKRYRVVSHSHGINPSLDHSRKRSLVVNGTEIPINLPKKASGTQINDNNSVKVLVVQVTRGQTGCVKSYVSDVPVYHVYETRAMEGKASQGRSSRGSSRIQTPEEKLLHSKPDAKTESPPYPVSLYKVGDSSAAESITDSSAVSRSELDEAKVKKEPPFPVSLYKVVDPSEQSAMKQTKNHSVLRTDETTETESPYPVSLYKVNNTSRTSSKAPSASSDIDSSCIYVKSEPIDTGYPDDIGGTIRAQGTLLLTKGSELSGT